MLVDAFSETANCIVNAGVHLALTVCEQCLVSQDVLNHLKYFGQQGELAARGSVGDAAEREDACLDVVLFLLAKRGHDFNQLGPGLLLDSAEERVRAKLKAIA